MDNKKIKSIVTLLRQEGVLKFRTKDVEIELSPSSLFPEKGTKKVLPIEDNSPYKALSQYSEEDVLLWSSGGVGAENN